jgi:hypothetical protein
MPPLSPAQAEEALRHVAQQFAQWRQRRTTPRGRIPSTPWAQAVTLVQVLPCTRVARHLGLTPRALKRRRDARGTVLTPSRAPAPSFVEVTPPWRTAATEVEVQRPDGARLRLTSSEASPTLVPLRQTFLDAH